MWKEFRSFIARGNVIDLAVGVIMGAAFGKIVTTFVESIVMPPIGVLTGRVDFSSLFVVLDKSKGLPASLGDAKTRGIPVIAYGQFINDVLSFVIVGFAVFLLVKQINRIERVLEEPTPGPTNKECPFCASTISIRAKRCPHCTSDLAPAAGR